MGNAFSADGPLGELLSKAWDLLVLNVLTLLCSLPLITAGCALTAAYSVCWQIKEGHVPVFRTFFTAFKANIKQATILWVILFLILQILLVDYAIVLKTQPIYRDIAVIVLFVAAIMVLMTMLWTFALQAHFENSVRQTLKNGFLLSIGYLMRSIAMVAMACVPIICFWLVDSTIVFAVVVFYGISLPLYGNSLLLRSVFTDLQKTQVDNTDS